jgi:hypothetical protein
MFALLIEMFINNIHYFLIIENIKTINKIYSRLHYNAIKFQEIEAIIYYL